MTSCPSFEKNWTSTKIDYRVLDEEIPFEPYLKVVKSSAFPLDKDEVSEAESRGNIIDGYDKSVYPAYVFDSAQEKLLADSLEKDKTVTSWVRLRNGQLPIKYIYGNYNPDFIVERRDANYLVEVKDKSKLDKKDPEVLEKAKQAEEWCKIASSATKKKWVYKLLPHMVISRINSFNAIISSAYKIQ